MGVMAKIMDERAKIMELSVDYPKNIRITKKAIKELEAHLSVPVVLKILGMNIIIDESLGQKKFLIEGSEREKRHGFRYNQH